MLHAHGATKVLFEGGDLHDFAKTGQQRLRLRGEQQGEAVPIMVNGTIYTNDEPWSVYCDRH